MAIAIDFAGPAVGYQGSAGLGGVEAVEPRATRVDGATVSLAGRHLAGPAHRVAHHPAVGRCTLGARGAACSGAGRAHGRVACREAISVERFAGCCAQRARARLNARGGLRRTGQLEPLDAGRLGAGDAGGLIAKLGSDVPTVAAARVKATDAVGVVRAGGDIGAAVETAIAGELELQAARSGPTNPKAMRVRLGM